MKDYPFMRGESRKLQLIEKLLKVDDDRLLAELEDLLSRAQKNQSTVKSFTQFAGLLSDEEADELERIIEEGCEQIHEDDWK